MAKVCDAASDCTLCDMKSIGIEKLIVYKGTNIS